MQIKDNQINQILVKVDIIKHKFLMYRPEVRKHKGKSLPIEIWSELKWDTTGVNVKAPASIRNSGGRTYLVTVKELL